MIVSMRTASRALGVVFLVILASSSLATRADAHPGSGIVVDRDGNVFFVIAGSNVIMKLTRDGKASVLYGGDALRLPHHLVLGKDGTLYTASDFDGKVWRVGADGTLQEHFNSNRAPPASGQPELYVGFGGDPFTIDAAGNVYALATKLAPAVVRITTDGKVTPIARNAKFGELHFSSMTWGADGALYLTDENRVWRIVEDSATAIVPRGVQLSRATGISVDSAGNIYVADYGARRVVRFAPDGSVSTPPSLARLSLKNPTGIAMADGAIYVLDNPPGGVAVWRLRGDEADLLYSQRAWRIYAGSALLIVFPLLLALQTWVRKPSGRIDWLVWTAAIAAIIVTLYWVAREAYLFSILRHAILAFFAIAAWKSYQRVKDSSRAPAPAATQ